MRRSTAPLWFSVCVAAALGLVLRALLGTEEATGSAGGRALETSYAFWGLVIGVITWIWRGVEAAGKITLTALGYSVKLLWTFAQKTANALIDVGHGVLTGLQKAWKFFELTYEKVLKPAWTKFWRWFDKFRSWLDQTFGPVIEWLRELRDNLLGFWKTYVRPWLDLIDATRRVLRVLSSLGLSWARELDRKLAELSERIERPFRVLLAKVNEVINLVNRVVTLDGLIQRVALIRSMERDVRFFHRALVNWRIAPLGADDWRHVKGALDRRTPAEVTAEFSGMVARGEGPLAPVASEMALVWAQRMRTSL